MAIRWGILGCGKVCEVKSGPGFQRAEGSRLVAVMRRDAAKAADFAQRHGVPKWYDDPESLILDPEIDAIYIATPVGTHAEYALKVAAARKPAYVEKPMARNYAECLRMIDAFARADRPLFVAYYRRALPRFLKTRQLIRDGAIGTVTGVSCHYTASSHERVAIDNLPWRLVAEESGGGLFMDLGSHTLDILDFLVGPIAEVGGAAANVASPYDVEDRVAMHFALQSGALGTASWNFAAGLHEDLIEIMGTRGAIRLSTFGDEPVRLERPSGVETFDLPNPPHIQQPLIQTIVDQLQGRGMCESTGVSAARTARVMDLVLQGYYGSRADGFWLNPQAWPGRRRQARADA